MTTLDVTLLVVLAFFLIRGFWRGFIRETLGLAALLGGGVAAAFFAEAGAAELTARDLVRPVIATPVAGGLIFLATYVGVNFAGWGLDKLARRLFLGPLLRIAGMLFALVKGALLAGLVLLGAQRFLPWIVTPEQIESSQLATPLVTLAETVLELGGEWLGTDERAAAEAVA